MIRRSRLVSAAVGCLSFGLGWCSNAQAQDTGAGSGDTEQGIAACGDIHVEAQAQCEVVPPGIDCETKCTPLSVQAACAAELSVQCEGMCNIDASVDCNVECQAGCTADCMVDPGKFDCSAQCQASCSGDCAGSCEASSNKAECMASCQGHCAGSCDASCDVRAPSVDCKAECQASCSGSCKARANIDCQVDCQSSLYADCKVKVEGGCKTKCDTQEGALFCDGQYVDYGNNLEQCVAAIEAVINSNVEGYAEGSSSCTNGSCMADGSAGLSCSALPGASSSGAPWGLALLLGLVAVRRRRT